MMFSVILLSGIVVFLLAIVLMDWLARINERPAAKLMFAKSRRESLAPRPNTGSA